MIQITYTYDYNQTLKNKIYTRTDRKDSHDKVKGDLYLVLRLKTNSSFLLLCFYKNINFL